MDGLLLSHTCLGIQWGRFQTLRVPQVWNLAHLEAPSLTGLVSRVWCLEGCIQLDDWLENLYMASLCGLDFSRYDSCVWKGTFRNQVFQATQGKWHGTFWPCFSRHIASLLPHAISWWIHKISQVQGVGHRPSVSLESVSKDCKAIPTALLSL